MDDLVAALAASLLASGMRLAVAESCTGGGLAYALTGVAGSSVWFDRGFVSYSNEAKSAMLEVDPVLIDMHGAVSGPVACAMALGARRLSGVDLAVAITGIAGPGGGRPGKPVGTVFIAVATARGVSCRACHFSGDRQEIRRQSIETALKALIEHAKVNKNT